MFSEPYLEVPRNASKVIAHKDEVTKVKRETLLATSVSPQYFLAWRSEESGKSAKDCQSEAQPGDGKSASSRSGASAAAAKSPARGQYPKRNMKTCKGTKGNM